MGQPEQQTAAQSTLAADGAAVLEIERFEWAAPDQIVLAGVWSGLRGRRFIRPTLVLKGEGQTKRLLATLEHKPWTGEDGADWVAAFAWDGEPAKFESAELNVGSGIDLELPAPKLRPGKGAKRFRHRAVSRDASRDAPDPEATAAMGATELTDPTAAVDATELPADATAAMDGAAAPEVPSADGSGPAALADAEARIRALLEELDAARSARDRMREERDAAVEQTRIARQEIEDERQRRERAIAAARAEEREGAATMLTQGAELRASVERQRELAYAARDTALRERDEARAERDAAVAERKDAVAARKTADRDRERAVNERDHAERERERSLAACREAEAERDAAVDERDTVVALHERGLPVKQPQPKYWPRSDERSPAEVWAPRAVASGVLLIFAFVVLRLFAGL